MRGPGWDALVLPHFFQGFQSLAELLGRGGGMGPEEAERAVIGRGGAVLQSGLPGSDPADDFLQVRPALRQVFGRGIRLVLQVDRKSVV